MPLPTSPKKPGSHPKLWGALGLLLLYFQWRKVSPSGREMPMEEYLHRLRTSERPWIKGGESNPSPDPPAWWEAGRR